MFEIQMITDGHSLIEEVSPEKAVEIIDAWADDHGISREEAGDILRLTLTPEGWASKFPDDRLTGEGRLSIVDAMAQDDFTEEDWELILDWAYLMTSGPIEDIEGFLDDARDSVTIYTGGLSHREILEALADHWLEAVEEEIPEFIAPYIDREAYGRDIMTSHSEGDYYVFSS